MTVPYIFGPLTGASPIQVKVSHLDDNFSYLVALLPNPVTTAYTSNHTVTTGESSNTLTNEGASGAVTLTLPPPSAGLLYTFAVVANQTLTITCGGSTVITLGEVTSTAGGNISSATSYSVLTLKVVSNFWVALSVIGTWVAA